MVPKRNTSTPVEYKIVAYLSKRTPDKVAYLDLGQNVWGPTDYITKRIGTSVNMANIRRKIERNPSQPQFLFTEVGVDYRREDENEM